MSVTIPSTARTVVCLEIGNIAEIKQGRLHRHQLHTHCKSPLLASAALLCSIIGSGVGA
jgi:hypothetical protein